MNENQNLSIDEISLNLKKLMELASQACEMAKKDQDTKYYYDMSCSVKWDNACCVDAEYCIKACGNGYYRVYIENVDPEGFVFTDFIAHYLQNNGFKDVSVDID